MSSYSYSQDGYDSGDYSDYDDAYEFLAASHGRFDSGDDEPLTSAAKMQSAFLTKPVLEKETAEGSNSELQFATCTMQGWRAHQEDQMVTIPDFPAKSGGFSFGPIAVFAVCDGHGGGHVSDLLAKEIPIRLQAAPKLRKDPGGTLERVIVQLDKDLLSKKYDVGDRAGSTCVVAVINKKTITVSNTGDSRCVLCRDGKAVPLTVDHEPSSKEEQRRIEGAGGFVANNRVNGKLALSRSVGNVALKLSTDRPYHQRVVVATPDIRTARRKGVSFLVIACDGIWEVMSNSEVINFVQAHLVKGTPLVKIAQALVHACVAPEEGQGATARVGRDNMSVIIVEFLGHKHESKGVIRHVGAKAAIFKRS
jgi:protein phosphatase 2C family protein 2/3